MTIHSQYTEAFLTTRKMLDRCYLVLPILATAPKSATAFCIC